MELYGKYLASSYRYLGRRSRSVKEMRDYLIKKKASSEIIEKVIATLIEQKFLNDRTFAKWWVEQRLRFNPKSLRVIKLELRQKGIESEIIDAVTHHPMTITNEALPNELETAKKLVEKKLGKYKDLPRVELYQKLGGFLARRGFSWEVIKASIDEVLQIQYNRK